MFAKTVLAAGAALALAAPATAATQLERSLGVEPGVYTTAELVQLKSAISDDNQRRIEFILNKEDRTTAATRATATPSLAERTTVGSALEANEVNRARFISENGVNSEARVSNAGKAQLAASLGVAPQDYTLDELILLRKVEEDDGRN